MQIASDLVERRYMRPERFPRAFKRPGVGDCCRPETNDLDGFLKRTERSHRIDDLLTGDKSALVAIFAASTRIAVVAVSDATAAAVAALFCLSRRPSGNCRRTTSTPSEPAAPNPLQPEDPAPTIDDSRSALNGAHKLIRTVSKGLAKQPS
jgi:hypothetical protein